jgi:hypothetical protein
VAKQLPAHKKLNCSSAKIQRFLPYSKGPVMALFFKPCLNAQNPCPSTPTTCLRHAPSQIPPLWPIQHNAIITMPLAMRQNHNPVQENPEWL